MAQLPCQEHLDHYYELFKQGYTDEEIFKSFKEKYGMSKSLFKKWYYIFFHYTKNAVKVEAQDGIVPIPLTAALEDKFVDLVSQGVPWDKVARLMNIPLATITEFWFQYPLFKARVDYAVEMANIEVIKALHKRATGYSTILKTKTTSRTQKENGEILTNITETEREEQVVPSVEAEKFWLINRMPEKWSTDGSSQKEGNKGKILEALEKMSELTAEDKKELEHRK